MINYLTSTRVWVRFISLFMLTMLIFLMCWVIGYYALPEGILRGKFASAALVGDRAADTFLAEFTRIVLVNVVMLMPIVAGNRVFKHKEIPLGYVIPLAWGAIYALIIGTNSTSIAMPERLTPSLMIFTRSGLYEIGAFVLAAAATSGISAYRVIRFVPPESEKITPAPMLLKVIHWPALMIAIMLLLAANAWEAYQIVQFS
jgi:hypothetical protein